MRLGRKGERTGIKKTLYMSKVWNETVKEYSEKTKLPQHLVVEILMNVGNAEFRRRYNLDEEQQPSKEVFEETLREKRERLFHDEREKRLNNTVLDYENSEKYSWTE
jgi:hypothetical protein